VTTPRAARAMRSTLARLKRTVQAFASFCSRGGGALSSASRSPGVTPSWYEVEVLLRSHLAKRGRTRWLVLSADWPDDCPRRFTSHAAARHFMRDLTRARFAEGQLVALRVVQRVPAGTSEEECAAVARYSRSAARAWPGAKEAFPDPDAAIGVAVGRAFVRGYRAGKTAASEPRELQLSPTAEARPAEHQPSRPLTETGGPARRDTSATEEPDATDPATWTPEEREIAKRRYQSALKDVVSVPEREDLFRVLYRWEEGGRDPLSVATSAQGFLIWYLQAADLPHIPSGTPLLPGPSGPIGESALTRLEELSAQMRAEERDGMLAIRGVVTELMAEASNFLGMWKYYQEARRDAEEGS